MNIAVDFVEIMINNNIYTNEEYAKEIMLAFLIDNDITIWMAEVTGLIVYGEVISGKLYVSSLDQKIQIYQKSTSIELTNNAIVDNTENCLKWALFNINLLSSLCSISTNKNRAEESDEKVLIHNLNLPGVTSLLINVIHSIILGQIYSSHYKSVSINQ